MNAFSKPDMSEVGRLTRAGRLQEAMALLQAGTRPETAPASSAGQPEAGRDGPSGPVLDMVKAGQSWALRQAQNTTGRSSLLQPSSLKPRAVIDALSKRLSRLGPLNPLSGVTPDRAAGTAMPPGARFEEFSFSVGAGSRSYMLFVPSSHANTPMPLVVMLHGCQQTPVDFAAGTGMNALAEERGFLVAYPGQPQSANASRCWNWFNPGDQRRDSGEPALIAGITRQIIADFGADPRRVYVAGLSAGGAEAAIMAATYPDLYAAVGVHSGLACGAAVDLPSALAAMRGDGPVRARGSARAVPTIVFHGDADRTVHPVNAERIVSVSEAGPDLRRVVATGETPEGVGYTQISHLDQADRSVVERWVLHGAGHAWSGGNKAGSYTDPRGPDASVEMLRFFKQHAQPA